MSEFKEQGNKRQYDDLSPPDRVKAILAFLDAPTGKSVVLEIAGIDVDVLQEDQRKEVEGIFESGQVKVTDAGDIVTEHVREDYKGVKLYKLTDQAAEEIAQTVDGNSVEEVINAHAVGLFEELYEDEGPSFK